MISQNIAFLLGSGISIYSGLKNVNEITDIILTTNNVARNGDSNYYFFNNVTSCKNVISIQDILTYLKNIIDQYHYRLKIPYKTNYEELYYLLDQIENSEEQEYENPAIYPLIESIESNFKDEISFHDNNLVRYIRECKTYIHYVVFHLLQQSNGKLNQFKIISEIQANVSNIDIFTLNHDILLETYLKETGIVFNYGFEPNGRISVFNHKLLEKNNGINLFKLHGSIDWSELNDGKENKICCLPLNYNTLIGKSSNLSEKLNDTVGLPLFLIGTFNKMLNYLTGIYELIFDVFKNRILKADLLIISGYGFSDKGINARISHFINQHDKKIIIIHPNKSDLIKNARGNPNLYTLNNSNVRFIEKKFEEIVHTDLLGNNDNG